MKQPSLFDTPAGEAAPPDQAARDFAVDPAHDVVLEASAGTGKTRVLVDRYVRLIESGVDPRHILAITFTRKAAAEMRDRVLLELRRRADKGAIPAGAWEALQARIGDVEISTIDAFCFGLLREFPLEAGVDPGFDVADETEMARFANEALDLALRAARALLVTDEPMRLLFARVKLPILRQAVASLLDRRDVALRAVRRFVDAHPSPDSAAAAAARFVARIRDLVGSSPHRSALVDDGPLRSPEFRWLHDDFVEIERLVSADQARIQQFRRRLERYFLTKDGRKPRQRLAAVFGPDEFRSREARSRHEAAIQALAPRIEQELKRLEADIDALLARGLYRLLAIAADKYEELLTEHALLDFAGMLKEAVELLDRQEEFARSRLKLQSRYHHVLVDEFQDTSRLQWRLVERLIDAWGEGEGAADAPTSIFVVGDRKQSIYRFRDADVTLLDEAAAKIGVLRPAGHVRQSIAASFRAVPELLAFVNALSHELQSGEELPERFRYAETDRFPVVHVAPGALRDGQPVLGLVAQPSMAACAAAVAAEIERILASETVRDRSGPPRPARPDDIGILFRSRAGHQYFEEALEARGIRTYVYKGLGFFDAPEVQDLQALLRYLAQPESDLRAAEFLRSRFVRLSDVALVRLAPAFAAALAAPDPPAVSTELDPLDRQLLDRARAGVATWRRLADRVTPGELIDTILHDSAYAYEMRGRRFDQARENVKKVRSLVRRVESRGYATLGRLAEYFDTLRAGDESNAVVEATGAVSLMTIHAAKGLEFPIIFVVNLDVAGRGSPSAFSVIDRGPTGEPEVTFHSTDATRLEERREGEELRRLFYVAVTRARDRLYLAAEIDQKGRLRRPARSLARLLPETLAAVFSQAAATNDDRITWQSENGEFAFRICRTVAAARRAATVVSATPVMSPTPVVGAMSVVSATGVSAEVVNASAAAGETEGEGRTSAGAIAAADHGLPAAAVSRQRLLGTLVHRLMQRELEASIDEARLAELIPRLVRADELVDVADVESLGRDAAAVYTRLRASGDLVTLLATADCHYEVPFSFESPDRPGELIRGVIDCVVTTADGATIVLEFKTGRDRPEHEVQAAVYARAMAAALGIDAVEVRVVYA